MNNPAILIFGATGDLAKKKLLPALVTLYGKKQLVNTPIIAIGRRPLTKEAYIDEMQLAQLKQKNPATYDIFTSNLSYIAVDVEEKHPATFATHLDTIDKRYKCNGERICYLATSSDLFVPILGLLKRAHALDKKKTRIAFEKPFGHDLASARALDKAITRFLPERQVYRVDHYLAKSMTDALQTLRFMNPLFANLWNRESIENVQIIASENFGIEGRGEYYDKTGAIRDFVQNHLLQLLALVGMEQPRSSEAEAIRNEKVKVLKKIKVPSPQDIIRGQYEGYTNESEVVHASSTETFVAATFYLNSPRWKNVPFYIKTGKHLDKKYSEVNIVLKASKGQIPGVISIRLGPDQEGIALLIYTKDGHGNEKSRPITLEYCHKCDYGPNTPEAYENIFLEIMRANHVLFPRSDEVEASWKCTDALIKNAKKSKLHVYSRGSQGPTEAHTLLNKRGHAWVYVERKITI